MAAVAPTHAQPITRPRKLVDRTTAITLAAVAVVVTALVAGVIGFAAGNVTGSIAQRERDQRAICEAEGPLARFNDRC